MDTDTRNPVDADAVAAAESYLSLVPPKPKPPVVADAVYYWYFWEQIGAASLCQRLSAIYTVATNEFTARRVFGADSNMRRLRTCGMLASEPDIILRTMEER